MTEFKGHRGPITLKITVIRLVEKRDQFSLRKDSCFAQLYKLETVTPHASIRDACELGYFHFKAEWNNLIPIVCIVAFNLILSVSFYSTVLCSGTFLLSSDIRSDGNIAIVKKIDFDFFMVFDSISLPYSKMCFRKIVCVCVCLSVCLSV